MFCVKRIYVLTYRQTFIKNVSYSTSHTKNSETVKLRNFSFFLSINIIFIYEPILIKICMNAYIMKTHIFYKMKYDLHGH